MPPALCNDTKYCNTFKYNGIGKGDAVIGITPDI